MQQDEQKHLRQVALQNARAVSRARERAERELRDANRRTTAILDSITDGFFALDRNWRFTYLNRQACELLGPIARSREPLIGKSLWEELPHLLGSEVEQSYRRSVAERVPVMFEVFSKVLNDWFEVRAYPGSEGLSVYFHSVSERRHSEHIQSRLAAVVESSDDAILSLDLNTIIITWNRGAERIFGYTAEETIGQSVTILIPPGLEDEEPKILQRLRDGERIEHFETIRRRKDGSLVDVSLTVSAILDANGEMVGASKISRDITEAKRHKEALRRSEEELRVMANSIPQLAWMAHPDGRIYWYNRRWFDYTGQTLEAMQGWGWQAVHHPEFLPRVVERWQKSLESGTPFDMEFPLRGADGVFRWFLTRVNPFRDSTGAIVRWFGTNTEVDELRRTQQALQDETRTLELLNETGKAIASEVELEKVVQFVTDSATKLTGAKFGAFFYNIKTNKGNPCCSLPSRAHHVKHSNGLGILARPLFSRLPLTGLRRFVRMIFSGIRDTATWHHTTGCPEGIYPCAVIWQSR